MDLDIIIITIFPAYEHDLDVNVCVRGCQAMTGGTCRWRMNYIKQPIIKPVDFLT